MLIRAADATNHTIKEEAVVPIWICEWFKITMGRTQLLLLFGEVEGSKLTEIKAAIADTAEIAITINHWKTRLE